MRKWLMKKLGIFRKRNEVELSILNKLDNTDFSDEEKDVITDIVKDSLDEEFTYTFASHGHFR